MTYNISKYVVYKYINIYIYIHPTYIHIHTYKYIIYIYIFKREYMHFRKMSPDDGAWWFFSRPRCKDQAVHV